ncbi:MFS general substrate transporter [Artomyces pyxidatus]|uniref:MFS general substrate transporter n=1 Tax=Artomyces pyxidatus TaxID=48021 RepID=A0ACB8T8N7_9AGAM|nr:MFS general substrate transporter [Artomyces pyxidatus]
MNDGEHTVNASRHRRELLGWLTYAFASEVFVIVSLTLFLPICLEQFARDNGYLLPEKTVPCSSAREKVDEDVRCVVKLGWAWIDTASFSLYVYSMSVALQALTVISMGGIADHPPHRKPLLSFFAFLGSFSALLFLLLPSSSTLWPFSGLLAIFANIGFGASIVVLNSYLPSLARSALASSPTSLALEDDGPTYTAQLSRTTSRISSLGIALGYAAGIALLALTLVPVTRLGGSTFALRLAIGGSGAWWALFSVPAIILLPSVRAQEAAVLEQEQAGLLAGEDAPPLREKDWNTRREIIAAWRRLGTMLRWREIKRLRNTFRYLAAWFLLSDGFTTLTSTALLFAKTTLHLPASALILVGVLSPSAGILGALLWPVLQRRYQMSNLRVLVLLVGLASLIPAYGCIGLFFGAAGGWGLRTAGEMYVLAVFFGSVYGAFQSYARALYAEIIPPGEEARWYGLFSITDKSSSFLGPLIVGVIADTTGNIRYAFFFLVLMLWAALPVLWGVDVERGRADAQALAVGDARREDEGRVALE